MYDKDVIIAQLTEKNRNLQQQVVQLTELAQTFRDKMARLEKNSSNSSKPPSAGIIDPQFDRKKKRKHGIGVKTVTPNAVGRYRGCQSRRARQPEALLRRHLGRQPRGEIIAQAGSDDDELLLADCNLDQIDEVRQIYPFFRDRRQEAYDPLCQ